MKTTIFQGTIGVNVGYGHNNVIRDAKERVSKIWQQEAAKEYKNYGTYPGAVVSESLSVYHTDWGCPDGGEIVASVTGQANPNFTDLALYRESVERVFCAVAQKLSQSTAQLAFYEADFVYFEFNKK